VSFTPGSLLSTALIGFGWIAFICGALANPKLPFLAILFKAIARVLP
jgi:hypothetical protein